MTVTVKALKVTVVLPPDQLPEAPEESTLVLTVATPDGLRAIARLNAKSYRKTLAALAQHGAENVAVLLQGQMTKPGIIDSAGLSAVPHLVAWRRGTGERAGLALSFTRGGQTPGVRGRACG